MPPGVSRIVKSSMTMVFFGVGEAEEALHRAVFRSHPLLLGSRWAEMAFPSAGEPGKILERGFVRFGRHDDDCGVRAFFLRGAEMRQAQKNKAQGGKNEDAQTAWSGHGILRKFYTTFCFVRLEEKQGFVTREEKDKWAKREARKGNEMRWRPRFRSCP